MLLLSACSTRSGGRTLGSAVLGGGDPNRDPSAGTGFGEGGANGPNGGGSGDGPLGGGGVNAAPLVPQSLIDDGQPHSIGLWGPVEYTQQVAIPGGGTTTVTRLASVDPFTATWQLEDGTIVVSNEPLTTIVARLAQEPPPAAEQWTGPDNNVYTITSHRILVWFKPVATQQNIETFNAAHNLSVVMSWFEPPEEEGAGNAIAYFEYEYNPLEFATFSAAYAYFNAHPLVAWAEPITKDELRVDYSTPNDPMYGQFRNSVLVDSLHLIGDANVDFGLPTGQQYSDQVIAVVDSGVYRNHDEFDLGPDSGGYPSLLNGGNKVSWTGVYCYNNSYAVGRGFGEPLGNNPHGTQVAGILTASTNNGVGIASLAPRACVLPIAMKPGGNPGSFDTSAPIKAVRALRFQYYRDYWLEEVRVVNNSYGGARPFSWRDPLKGMKYNIDRDILKNDRLYVASAGNFDPAFDSTRVVRTYPAAFSNVLGVTGFYAAAWDVNYTVTGWSTTGTYGGKAYSSYYYPDSYASYEISGIFAYQGNQTFIETPVPPNSYTGHGSGYNIFAMTSCCCPEVSALAFQLFTKAPNASAALVWNHLVSADSKYLNFPHYAEMAPVIDFHRSLSSW